MGGRGEECVVWCGCEPLNGCMCGCDWCVWITEWEGGVRCVCVCVCVCVCA